MNRRYSFSELGEHIAQSGWGYVTEHGSASDALKSDDGLKPSAETGHQRDSKYLLAAIAKHLASIDESQDQIVRCLRNLPNQISSAIAKGEERACKDREKAAAAELAAKQENPTVTIVQCPNEVIDKIPWNRMRGRW